VLLMRIEPATDADLPSIKSLLVANALVLDGADQAFETGVVARADGAVVGAAAVELYGEHALLRSVVVDGSHRNQGLGRRLVAGAEALARSRSARDAYLLTESAVDYFRQLGYTPIDRGQVPGQLSESVEFTTACADSAVAMVRTLA
jgi:amino-acid N-acetyltransferase